MKLIGNFLGSGLQLLFAGLVSLLFILPIFLLRALVGFYLYHWLVVPVGFPPVPFWVMAGLLWFSRLVLFNNPKKENREDERTGAEKLEDTFSKLGWDIVGLLLIWLIGYLLFLYIY